MTCSPCPYGVCNLIGTRRLTSSKVSQCPQGTMCCRSPAGGQKGLEDFREGNDGSWSRDVVTLAATKTWEGCWFGESEGFGCKHRVGGGLGRSCSRLAERASHEEVGAQGPGPRPPTLTSCQCHFVCHLISVGPSGRGTK